MRFEYSNHWRLKRFYRREIADYILEYAILNSPQIKDKQWEDALNAVTRVPPSGRLIKVVYRIIGKDKIKIITAFWLD